MALSADSGMHADAAAADVSSNLAQVYGQAWLQTMCVYYGVAILLHFVVPAITSPKRVQHGEVQARGDTFRDAARALVPVFSPFPDLSHWPRCKEDAHVCVIGCKRPSMTLFRVPGCPVRWQSVPACSRWQSSCTEKDTGS